MQTYELTPEVKSMPKNWGLTNSILPVTDQNNENILKLKNLAKEFHAGIQLNGENIHKTNYTTDLLSLIYHYSYPLRGIEANSLDNKIKTPKELLGYWEVYSYVVEYYFNDFINDKINVLESRSMSRAESQMIKYNGAEIKLRNINFRSFHIHDNLSSSILPLKRILNNVEAKYKLRIVWDWNASYIPSCVNTEQMLNKNQWVVGADEDGDINVQNMHSWKNRILVNLKHVDAIIGNEDKNNLPAQILFAVLNLDVNGLAIINLPKMADTSTVTAVYIFSQCFERTEIVHTQADDRTYLCGTKFIKKLSLKVQKLLYNFCDVCCGSESLAPFVREHLDSDHFLEMLVKIYDINAKIYESRYNYYEKLLITYNKLYRSAARITFSEYNENFLNDVYADQSKTWTDHTGFKF